MNTPTNYLPREDPMCCFFVVVAAMTSLLTCADAAHAQKSLVIGIDALGSHGLRAADTPNIDRLIEGTFGGGDYQGAFSPHAFVGGVLGTASQQPTVSGPGWTSILTGVWTDKHRVTGNGFSPQDLVSNPLYFKTLEQNVPDIYTASIINWSPIDTHAISTVGQMDFRSTPGNDLNVANVAAAKIAALDTARPAAVFIHFDEVDAAAHSSGSYSQGYLNEIRDTDARVGQLLAAIENRASFASEDWQIILTADHGQRGGGGHGGQSALERTVPLLVAGRSVAQGVIPASTVQPSVVDVAPTVLDFFGVQAPGNIVGQSLGKNVLPHATGSLSAGLVSHIPFDGSAAAGIAGHGGTVSGSVNYADGRFGQAVGVTDYGDGFVRLNDDLGATFATTNDFSFSFWMRYDSFSSDAAFFSNKDWTSGSNTGINLAFNPNNTLDVNTKADAGVRSDVHPFEALEPEVWQNIVLTVDRDGATNIFVDGTLFGQIANSSQGSLDGAFDWVLLNDGTGSYDFGSTTTGLQIDEFAAWNRLLTLDEISTLSVHPISTPTLPADLTNNGFVDFQDLTILLANWNKPGATAAEGNLVKEDTTSVDFADLTTLLADWTGPAPGGAPEADLNAEAVPEPSSSVLALWAALGLSLFRRGKPRSTTTATFRAWLPRRSRPR
jgi:hypothetical protein